MQIPLDMLEALFSRELAVNVWPFFRIAGVVMVAPVFGARLVPMRTRLAFAVAATYVLSPLVPLTPPFEISLRAGFIVAQEVLIGAAMGFCLQMIFDALITAGQTIAMSMGLGLATMIDPQRGVSVPVISQFFLILGTLIFLSLGGHLATIRLALRQLHAAAGRRAARRAKVSGWSRAGAGGCSRARCKSRCRPRRRCSSRTSRSAS